MGQLTDAWQVVAEKRPALVNRDRDIWWPLPGWNHSELIWIREARDEGRVLTAQRRAYEDGPFVLMAKLAVGWRG